MSFAEDHPYGSARHADPWEITHAFRDTGGVPFGFLQGRKLTHSGQAGMLLVGGAGSQKFTSVIAHLMKATGRGGEPVRCKIFDPKGEFGAVIGPGLVSMGAKVFLINPYRMFGMPNHRVSLLGHLKPGSRFLVGDSRRTAAALITISGGSEARFFEQTAQKWLNAIIRGLVHQRGGVSLASLYETVSMIRADPDGFVDLAADMVVAGTPDIEATLKEMVGMSGGEARVFHSVMTETTNGLAFMADPALRDTFVDDDRADFSLDVLTEDSRTPVFVIVMMPPDLIEVNAPAIRQCFSTMRTVKQRNPQSPTVDLIIDEAAQLKSFPEIGEYFSIGRGFGLCPLAVYQDIGQIARNLGEHGAKTVSASAAIEVYLGGGVSELNTAHNLSERLGEHTLHVDARLVQERARQGRREAFHQMMFGGADLFETAMKMRHLSIESGHRERMGRRLKTVDEIITLPHDRALVWASGYGLRSFEAEKRPYHTMSEYAGLYFPNPYFNRSLDTLTVTTRWGRKTCRVITERVPGRFAHLPQYCEGYWRYIEGYRPRV